MKKTYFSPISKVYNIQLKDGILNAINASLTGNQVTNPDGSGSLQEETQDGAGDGSLGDGDGARMGSTNIWSNEW